MSGQPVVIHVTRPYADADAYLTHEAWTIDARSMLLVDQAELPRDTNIVFDVTLGDGTRPIRAEARVLGKLEPARGKPGGLRVRFKRYGASTKAFIDRAVALLAASTPQSSIPPQPPLVLELGASSDPMAAAVPPAPSLPAQPIPFTPVPPAPLAGSAPPDRNQGLERLRARSGADISVPEERELLLERLRQRGQSDDVTMRFLRA
ncbi:MAG TPA: hypothetical protein VGK73_18890 [Polyangiaceae bacterium]